MQHIKAAQVNNLLQSSGLATGALAQCEIAFPVPRDPNDCEKARQKNYSLHQVTLCRACANAAAIWAFLNGKAALLCTSQIVFVQIEHAISRNAGQQIDVCSRPTHTPIDSGIHTYSTYMYLWIILATKNIAVNHEADAHMTPKIKTLHKYCQLQRFPAGSIRQRRLGYLGQERKDTAPPRFSETKLCFTRHAAGTNENCTWQLWSYIVTIQPFMLYIVVYHCIPEVLYVLLYNVYHVAD